MLWWIMEVRNSGEVTCVLELEPENAHMIIASIAGREEKKMEKKGCQISSLRRRKDGGLFALTWNGDQVCLSVQQWCMYGIG